MNRFLSIFLAWALVQPALPHEDDEQPSLPPNFYNLLLTAQLTGPSAMAVAPDGRVFVCEKGGKLRLFRDGLLLPEPFLEVTDLSQEGERGLLGVALDPGFASNRRLYLNYTARFPVPHGVVVRFTADEFNQDRAEAGSAVTLLELPAAGTVFHSGGGLHFGPDGFLYLSVGDDKTGTGAQSLTHPFGKILRFAPDGSLPLDNPFYALATGVNRAIWARGLRNPFSFAFQASGRLFLNDVGEHQWEEVNEGFAGANYGWPSTEGAFSPADHPSFTPPVYSYSHGDHDGDDGEEEEEEEGENVEGCAVVGAAFCEAPTALFPAPWLGRFFFADFCSGWIRAFDPPASGVTACSTDCFAQPGSYPWVVDLAFGPDGALYVLTNGDRVGAGPGALHRVIHSALPGPFLGSQPSPVTVAPGEEAEFSVRTYGAPPLSYQWRRNGIILPGEDEGELSLEEAEESDNGSFFDLVVSNGSGSVTSLPATLTVTANQPPLPILSSPPEGARYRAGDLLQFSGRAGDPEEGALPPSALTWWIDFHHGNHRHPAMPPASGITLGGYEIPRVGESSDNVWYRVYLRAEDGMGRAATVWRDVFPRKSSLVLRTSPAGLPLQLDGIPLDTPATIVAVEGAIRELGAVLGSPYAFQSWSDGGAESHPVTVGPSDSVFTASFSGPTPTPPPFFQPEVSLPFPMPLREGSAWVRLKSSRPGRLHWAAFTTSGRLLSRGEQDLPNGNSLLEWKPLDQEGGPLPNGLYFLRIRLEWPGGSHVKSLKVLLAR